MKRSHLWCIAAILLGLGLLVKACWMDWAEIYLTRGRTPHQRAVNKAAIEGIKLGLGLPPSETGQGIGRFTIKDVKGLRLTVPREYILFMPNEPDGETDALMLSFYLPDMKSRQAMRRITTDRVMYSLEVGVFISNESRYIRCRSDHECLDPPFGLFQQAIHFFQWTPPHDPVYETCIRKHWKEWDTCPPVPPSPRCLKAGWHDPTTNLMAYQSIHKTEVWRGPAEFNMIYLKPGADPCNPREWIKCTGHGCRQHWFRDGLYVESSFWRSLLRYHAKIRDQLDRKLDAFIKHN